MPAELRMTSKEFRRRHNLPAAGGDRRASQAFDLSSVLLCGTAIAGKPTPEHRFHPVRRWRLDYAWPKQKVAIEYEGIVSKGGKGKSRHATLLGYTEDASKYNHAQVLGWIVLRCTALSRIDDIASVLVEALERRST